MAPFHSYCRSSFAFPGVLALAVFVVSGSTGCSLLGNRYTPQTLPAEFQAKDIHSAQGLDISRFAHLATNSERIDRGDLLKVSVAAGLDAESVTNLYVRVNNNGTGILPEIGPLPLAGLSLMQAEQQITAICVNRQLYRQPLVTVVMEKQRANRIMVVGAVEEPGVRELPRGSSYLLDAVVAAGGFTKDAGAKITIRRPAEPGRLAGPEPSLPGASRVQLTSATQGTPGREPQLVCLDLADVRNTVNRSEYLPDGSVLTVEMLQPAPIQVIGLVRKPGQYDYPLDHDLHVISAIALGGGLTSKLANEILVLRNGPNGNEQVTVKVSLRAAKKDEVANLKLAPGDIVSVEPNAGTVLIDAINLLRFGIGTSLPVF